MRRSLLFGCALALAGATNAPAEAFTHDVHLEADVETACSFSAVPEAGGSLLNVISASQSTFTLPVDETQARVTALQSDALSFAQASCNATTTLTLTRTGFKHENFASQGSLPSGFSNEILYDASLNWGPGSPIVQLEEGGSNTDTITVGPRSATMTLVISVPPTEMLVSGLYADVLHLVVTPN